MKNQALWEAVNRAMEALEEIKRELERLEAAESAPPQMPTYESMPVPQPVSVLETRKEAERPVPQTSQLMKKAAKLASAVCGQWKFRDELGNVVDAKLLEYTAGEQDAAGTVDPDDPANYYIVSPDGAIGLTEDDGASVEWLFLPLSRTVASMPKTFKKGEPWPEATTAPTPPQTFSAPAQTVPGTPPTGTAPVTAPVVAAAPPTAPAPQSAPSSAAAGGVCPKCGKPTNPGGKFCMCCGAPLQAAAPNPAPAAPKGNFCLNCGAPIQPGDKFCMKCGAKA